MMLSIATPLSIQLTIVVRVVISTGGKTNKKWGIEYVGYCHDGHEVWSRFSANCGRLLWGRNQIWAGFLSAGPSSPLLTLPALHAIRPDMAMRDIHRSGVVCFVTVEIYVKSSGTYAVNSSAPVLIVRFRIRSEETVTALREFALALSVFCLCLLLIMAHYPP